MRLSRRPFLAGAAALAVVTLGACVPPPAPTPTPAPAPAPAPAPTPTPPPAPPPFAGNWMDAPLTPGDWRYGGGTATFAAPDGSALLRMRCSAGTVAIDRAGVAAGAAPSFIIRSESASRSLTPTSAGEWTSATLQAQDTLLDAMAFSKGRFAVENAGLPTLYVPSYPEVTRVIEDCR